MNRLFIKKLITSILFIGFILFFSLKNLAVSLEPIKSSINNLDKSSLKESIVTIDNTINENVYGKFKFIETYGYAQRLMNKNEESNFEVVKDNDGKLHFTYFGNEPNSTSFITSRMKFLKDNIKNPKTELIYMLTPDKFIEGHTQFPLGIPKHFNNETADIFLEELKDENIHTIDLRKNILQSGIDPSNLFFNTDHHWKIETAFWAFGQVLENLNKTYDLNLDTKNFYRDINNYNVIEYKNCYIGSQGRKTGKYYTDVDDFSLIYPKFKTNYDYYFENSYTSGTLVGRFEDALLAINPLRATGDEYGVNKDKYFSYLYGNQPFAHIKNKETPKGPKAVFIKDSLAVPVIAFLSTVFSDIYIIDPRYYNEDIIEFINSTEVDFAFVSYSPQNLVNEFFPW